MNFGATILNHTELTAVQLFFCRIRDSRQFLSLEREKFSHFVR